ncbi:MAG: hypothetical protein JO168_16725 [Solirubrobacterales bacterium]|nr:hypothetical protein [Solirubrobacterales bacterium]
MLDELRRDIERRLGDLLREADKLRGALTALGSDGARSSSSRAESSTKRSRRATTAPTTRRPARPRQSAATASAAAAKPPATVPTATSRAASGATKTAILAALASGTAMTAGEVARATGLGRASISTTLSRLAKSGEVTKAARGYQLTAPSATKPPELT